MKTPSSFQPVTINADDLNTGLRGYPVGTCYTSDVDPMKGLSYRGTSIDQCSHFTPEEVIYLIYFGKKGSKSEVEQFAKQLQTKADCSPKLIEAIEKLPRGGAPMTMLAQALLLAQNFEGKKDYKEDCLNLIAKIPEIAACVINTHAGWGKTPASKPQLGYMENFTAMVNVPQKDNEKLGETFRLFNVLHYDHGGGNLSTFVGKAVASGGQDLYGSMASAMLALAGHKHGGANQDCLKFVKGVLETLGPNATSQQVEQLIRDKLAKKELIFGFGHAVLRVEDARAKVLFEIAKQRYANDPHVKIALLLREAGTKVLKENPKVSDPYPNVDAISGVILSAAGFAYPEYYTVLFGLSRVVGISIQTMQERTVMREGKGVPIYRPDYFYEEQ